MQAPVLSGPQYLREGLKLVLSPNLRLFVLLPLAEIAPEWRHPVTGEPIDRLIAALPPDQTATPVE